MPRNKNPRHAHRRKTDWSSCVRYVQVLGRPWCADEWTPDWKNEFTIKTLEPVNALQHGDLRNRNWLLARHYLELGYLLASKTDQFSELRREIIAAYRMFCLALDKHLGEHTFLAANIEAVRRALVTVLDQEDKRYALYKKVFMEAFPNADMSKIVYTRVEL